MSFLIRLVGSLWGWLLTIALIGIASVYLFGGSSTDQADSDVLVLPAPETPFAAISRGVVDAEGGVIVISARSAGTFTDVYVMDGDYVEAGQLLARQDDTTQQVIVRDAKARLEQSRLTLEIARNEQAIAERDLARAELQFDGEAISEQEFDRAKDALTRSKNAVLSQQAGITQSENGVARALADLELLNVRAPLSGRIVEVLVRPGVGASTNQVSTAFVLVPDGERIVRLSVALDVVDKIAVGQDVVIASASGGGGSYDGTVARIAELFTTSESSSLRGASAPPTLYIIVAAPELSLRIGEPVIVRFRHIDSDA